MSATVRARQVRVAPSAAGPVLVTPGVLYTNEGCPSLLVFLLPPAAPGLRAMAYVQDVWGLALLPPDGCTVRAGDQAGSVSISSTQVGSYVELTAVNAVEWVATTLLGSWEVA